MKIKPGKATLATLIGLTLGACTSQPYSEPKPSPSLTRNQLNDSSIPPGAQLTGHQQIRPSTVITKTERLRKQALSSASEEQPISLASGTLSLKALNQSYVSTAASIPPAPMVQYNDMDGENYGDLLVNTVTRVTEQPVSTFSIDVDTGAYSNVRRVLNSGQLPPGEAVRVEELINYFDYAYDDQRLKDRPFSLTTEVGPSPWNSGKHLIHIGIKGMDMAATELPPSNLVFLVDVSGSMNSAEKLGLLRNSLKLLTDQMDAEDRISIVVYAGASGVVLEPTPGNDRVSIHHALNSLTAGGSTNGGAGIQLAYQLAQQAFIKNGINRVVLATDCDFNIGTTNFDALIDLVETRRRGGVALTTLGFGRGNYNDHLMEQLADAGNGNHAYIDTLNEAQKVLVDEISSTLNTIASDVKIQVEFNPAVVAEYRLIGYENRALNREDFNNDKVDAGEIGAGHTVTAIYEVSLAGGGHQTVEPLRYGVKENTDSSFVDELALLRLRYKAAHDQSSRLIEEPILVGEIAPQLSDTSNRFRFSAAVAAFGQQLRGGKWLHQFDYDDVLNLARGSRGEDRFGYRGEFVKLVNLARSLDSALQASTN